MPRSIQRCLLEALRRYHSFHAGKDPLQVWVGLGTPSAYRAAIDLGYMVPVSTVRPRIIGWYKLTPLGLAAILHLANQGYYVRDYAIHKH